ncbi:MAG: AAA family ATPase, partial [Candidatus Aureabacteria bacterium]|nr:AAA family ATPase [Candidatus Auribacterota bacterium]
MKKVYIGATRQNDGKTVLSLGLMHALGKKVSSIGFIKPVGQQYLIVNGDKIDKDVILMSRLYNLSDSLVDMSPIAIPAGFTEDYIHSPREEELHQRVLSSFEKVARGKDLVLIEGTGHAGVGAVFDLSNAEVARLLGAKVILVSVGGVGRPIDEILLNKAMFDQNGVEILGVIINQVKKDKYEKISTLVRKSLQSRGLEVLGVVPFDPILSSPTVAEIVKAINGEVISGGNKVNEGAGKFVIGAMPLSTAFDYFTGRYLLITPGNREDLILAALSHALAGDESQVFLSGIVITGGVLPHRNILNLVRKTDFPLITVKDDIYTTTTKITNLILKLK